MNKKLKVRDKLVFGKFRTRKAAETNKKLAEKPEIKSTELQLIR